MILKVKNYEKIKQNKPFEINDIFVYLIIVVLIFSLFFCLIILPKSTTSNGFLVYKNQDKVLTYLHSQNTVIVEDDFLSLVQIEKGQNSTTIKIYHDKNKDKYNVIVFDHQSKKAKMQQSTCSQSKDCTFLPAIDNSGMIYCAPHDLKIVPLNPTTSNVPPWTGGA